MDREKLIKEFDAVLQPDDIDPDKPPGVETLIVSQDSVPIIKFLMANYQEIYHEVTYSHYAKSAMGSIADCANEARGLRSKIAKYEYTAVWLIIVMGAGSLMLSLVRLFAG